MSNLREHWSSRLGFITAAIGSAIGLGILWKFPYVVGLNGGGLFLLAYLICILIVGLPIFIGELILGRNSQRAAVGAFEVIDKPHSAWRIAGWLGVTASFMIMSFYSVIAGWGMSYILMSLNGFYQGLSADEIAQVFSKLSHSGTISVFWHLLFTLITMGIVVTGVRKGIEYWSKIMVQILLILLIGLFLYSTSLEGFGKAVRFIFYPDVKNFSPSSLIEALGLAFWTLSIGQGIMISYGSYMKPTENIVKMAGIVGASIIVAACLASLMIFPVIFTFNLPAKAGPGLIFKTLPFLFAKLPGSMVISTMFFVLFVFTALTSAIPLIEVVASNIMELTNLPRKKAVVLVAIGTFLVGIPSAYSQTGGIYLHWSELFGMNFLDTINHLVSTWVIPVGGFFTAIFLGWKFPKEECKQEFLLGDNSLWFYVPWRFFIKWIVPLTILIIILQTSNIIDFDKLFKG